MYPGYRHMKRHATILSVVLLAVAASCSDAVTNEPYDEADVRAKTYAALYATLRLDTLGYAVMAVGEGDSLRDGFHWPALFRRHSASLFERLSGMLPLRIVGMDEVAPERENSSEPPYVTRDTNEPVLPLFTKTVERMDETRLVVVCGVYAPPRLAAYGACSLAHRDGAWHAESFQFYYRYEKP